MTISIPPNTTEAVRALGGSLGQMPDVASHLPVIVAMDEPAGWIFPWVLWSRGAASIGVSLLGHVGILAWLGLASSTFLPQRIPVEQGQASIQLDATFASAASKTTQMVVEKVDPNPTPPSWKDVAESPTSSEAVRPIPVSLARVDIRLPLPEEEAPKIDRPAEAAPTLPSLHRDDQQAAGPRYSPDPNPRMERSQVTVEPAIELVADAIAPAESVASSASDASMAAEGANSIPALVFNPAPQYPAAALRARQTGRVTVHVKIQPNGEVSEARVHKSCGIPELDQAALSAVRAWRFAAVDGFSSSLRQAAIPIRFVID